MQRLSQQLLRPKLIHRLKRLALCAIPVLIVAAILHGPSNALLVAVALSGFLAFDSTAPSTTRTRTRYTGSEIALGDEKNLLAMMDKAMLDPKRKVACVILEVDDFDKTQQVWGGDIASIAMPKLATKMASFLREYDEISRISENQFAVALCDIRSPELGAVISMIERLQSAIAEPLIVDGISLRLTASAGFALNSKVSKPSSVRLFDAAHAALDDARSYAPYAIRGYNKDVPPPLGASSAAQEEATNALKNGEIVPWFQPQVSTDTGEITGFEALARWMHPNRGVIEPVDFLQNLEDGHQMELLSETILINSLKALKSWDDAGFSVPSISVNFATQELRNPSLVERIKWDVDRFEIDPTRLVVEVLETVISPTEDDIIVRNIKALREQGFKIDLDDFGTGHASVANIRKFGVERIKIDQSFVKHVDEDPEQQRMIAAIVAMADQLQISALAEGVETIGEHAILSQLGCSHLQGHAIAKAMPLADTMAWISNYQNRLAPTPILKRKQQ